MMSNYDGANDKTIFLEKEGKNDFFGGGILPQNNRYIFTV